MSCPLPRSQVESISFHLHAAGASQTLPEAEHVATPKRSIAELEGLVAEAEAARAQQLEKLTEQTKLWQAQLASYDLLLENRFTFGRTRLQGERLADEKLLLLEGFVPTDDAPAFELHWKKLATISVKSTLIPRRSVCPSS